MAKFTPSAADLAFKSFNGDPFEEARLMQSISDEYLAVLAHDNSGPNSAGYKAMIAAEISRRGTREARRANLIARWSLSLALLACLIALGDAMANG